MEKDEFMKAKQSAENKLRAIAKDVISKDEWNGKEVLTRIGKELTHEEMVVVSGDTLYKRVMSIVMLRNKKKQDIAFQ